MYEYFWVTYWSMCTKRGKSSFLIPDVCTLRLLTYRGLLPKLVNPSSSPLPVPCPINTVLGKYSEVSTSSGHSSRSSADPNFIVCVVSVFLSFLHSFTMCTQGSSIQNLDIVATSNFFWRFYKSYTWTFLDQEHWKPLHVLSINVDLLFQCLDIFIVEVFLSLD